MANASRGGAGGAGTARRICGLMVPYAPQVALACVLAVLTVVATLLLPVLSGRAVDAVVGPGDVDYATLASTARVMAVAIVACALTQWGLTAVSNKIVYGMVFDLRTQAFAKIQRLPLSYIDRTGHGDVVARVVTDVDQFSNGLILAFQQFLTGALTIVLTLVFMARLNLVVTAVVLCVTPLSYVAAKTIASKSYRHFGDVTAARGELTSIAEETILGAQTVAAFDMQDAVCERFERVDAALGASRERAVFISSLTNPTTRFINSLVYAGVGIVGAFLVLGGTMTVGSLSAFLGYANQYTKPFNDISEVVTELQNSFACAQRLFDLLDERDEPADATDAVALGDVRGRVELADVCFSYVPERPLIRDVSLVAEPGQRIAIVGPTGCGKTTLINLLMRFYDIDGGAIRIDGHDVRSVTRESLRAAFGMVLQDTWIRQGTVRDNIAMARPDATDEEVREAARAAYADRFIEQLPQRYETVVGGDTTALSAGQRQLLCIARVMLARPRMLILDEATSNIDTRTELKVQRAFDRLMEGRTSFVVAHRLSTIVGADKIVAMRDGRVVEVGTHEELLARGGFYAGLYESQFESSA